MGVVFLTAGSEALVNGLHYLLLEFLTKSKDQVSGAGEEKLSTV